MGLRRNFVVAVTAVAVGVGGLLPVAAVADASPVANLYVGIANCSNSGTGTQARPYCSVQAAADVVQPGQSVIVGQGTYNGPVIISRSGTPDAPVVFRSPVGTAPSDVQKYVIQQTGTGSAAAVTLSGVHDVSVIGLTAKHAAGTDGFDVVGSTGVTFDGDITSQPLRTSPATTAAGFSVDGGSSGVSITRSLTSAGSGYGVALAAGARQVTLASSVLDLDRAGGLAATGVTGLVVTGDTVLADGCAPGVSVAGTSSATLEDNAMTATAPTGNPVCAATPLVTVSADAAPTVTTAYNALNSSAPRVDYAWAGTDYATAAALAAGVPGQAAADIDVPAADIRTAYPAEGSPLIDSADPHAPGVTNQDFFGNPRSADDPHEANTGGGSVDRGAFELQSVLTLTPGYDPASAAGVVPLHLAVTAVPTDSWGETVATTVDFGDGSGAQPVVGGTIAHSYGTPGRYVATTTATNADGQVKRFSQDVAVGTPAAPGLTLTAAPLGGDSNPPLYSPDSAGFTLSTGGDDWEIASGLLTFGDGSTGGTPLADTVEHEYPHAGTYTATVTTTDLLGRTSTATTTITVGDEIQPLPPVRDYDSRSTGGTDKVAAHATVKLSISQLHASYAGVDGVYLTATVTNPKAAGHLIAYADGTTRPGVSLLNFAAGQTVPNLTLAPVGADDLVDFYNDSSGPIDLLVDTLGIEIGVTGTNSGSIGDTYSPVGPTRLLDTRDGTGAAKGPVAKNGTVRLDVAGHAGVPSDAAAVLLNVTTTDAKTAGHLTAYGDGTDNPGTSASNWVAGQTVSNLVLVRLSDGKADLLNASGGTVDFVADVVGYYHSYGTASVVVPTPPTRVLDTRDGTGTAGTIAKIGPKQHVKLQISGHTGVPATGATAAEVNVTAVSPAATGFLSLYPDGSPLPTASTLNYRAGHTVANASVAALGADGAVDVYNAGGSAVDVVIDLSGYYYAYTG